MSLKTIEKLSDSYLQLVLNQKETETVEIMTTLIYIFP